MKPNPQHLQGLSTMALRLFNALKRMRVSGGGIYCERDTLSVKSVLGYEALDRAIAELEERDILIRYEDSHYWINPEVYWSDRPEWKKGATEQYRRYSGQFKKKVKQRGHLILVVDNVRV